MNGTIARLAEFYSLEGTRLWAYARHPVDPCRARGADRVLAVIDALLDTIFT